MGILPVLTKPVSGRLLLLDTFTGADGALLTAHTPNLSRFKSAWEGAAGWTITGNTAGHSPALGIPNLIQSPGFEDAGGGGADVFLNWSETIAGATTISDEVVDVYAGAHSCAINVDAVNSNGSVSQAVMAANNYYLLTLWSKADSILGGPQFSVYDGSASPAYFLHWEPFTAAYAQSVAGVLATHGTIIFGRSANCPGRKLLFDDVSLKAITATDLPLVSDVHRSDHRVRAWATLSRWRPGGVVARASADRNSYLVLNHDGVSTATFRQVVAGVPSTLATANVAAVAGAPFDLRTWGSKCQGFYNGVAIGAAQTCPAGLLANTRVGIWSMGGAPFTRFQCERIGGG